MRRSKVIGWWIVVTSGRPHLLDVEHPVAERLVVVDDVEVVDAAPAAAGRRAVLNVLRLGEAGGPHGQELLDVDAVAELARAAGTRNGSGSR